MPRRGRHRTRLPFRLLAAVAALLVGGTAVVLGGTALAKGSDGGNIISSLTGSSKSDGGSSGDKSDGNGGGGGKDSGSSDSKDSSGSKGSKGSKDSSGDSKDSSSNKDSGSSDSKDNNSSDNNSSDNKNNGKNDGNGESQDDKNKSDQGKDDSKNDANGDNKNDEFPGRDKISPASGDDFVDINDVSPDGGNRGNGGVFAAGSAAVNCGVSDHNNSDNFIAAPGKRNGAQHVHDYVGNTSTNANSSDGSLDAADTSCANGDKSTFYWPVLRDLNGQGPDVGQDGGSKDGNVGSILKPTSVQISYHGHGDQQVQAMPKNLKIITGNAKAKVQDGKNENAKYTCTGFTDRVTDKYPVCPAGSKLQRIIDFPSCWDGQNLDSKDHISHTAFPDEKGNCQDGFEPIPALHEVLTYNQPAGKAFSIDSFPDNQHDPTTDHGDFENVATEAQNQAVANCINKNQNCTNVTG